MGEREKNARQQPVPRHREPHSRLPVLKDQQRRNHPHERADTDDAPHVVVAQLPQCGHHGRGVVQLRPVHDTGQHQRDADVKNRADEQRHEDAERQIALRPLAFLGSRRDRVESDVGEEHDGGAGKHAAETVRHERPPVLGLAPIPTPRR